jgi:hypothetical protein
MELLKGSRSHPVKDAVAERIEASVSLHRRYALASPDGTAGTPSGIMDAETATKVPVDAWRM